MQGNGTVRRFQQKSDHCRPPPLSPVVVGVHVGKGTLEALANDIAQSPAPKLVPGITTRREVGRTVIQVEVGENPTKPVSA